MSTSQLTLVDIMEDSNSNSAVLSSSDVITDDFFQNMSFDFNLSLNDSFDNATVLPNDMKFTIDTLVSVITYPILFLIAAGGNLTVFITLLRSKGFKSHVNVFIMHLSIADLIVAFVFMPLETTWHVTVSWRAGDIACRICMFFR